MSATAPRIGIISVHYYAGYIERSIANLNALCDALHPVSRVLVANHPGIVERLHQEVDRSSHPGQFVVHDNVGMEFGAYQAALDRISAGPALDWVLVLNDTFGIHECFSAPLRNQLLRALRDPHPSTSPIAVGVVDEIARTFSLRGLRSHRWVRSSVMALNAAALRALDFRLHVAELDALISPAATVDEFFSAEVDPVLKDHLSRWLFSPGLPAGWAWYRAEHLDANNASRFAQKARCILQEKFISARLDHASTAFINIRSMSITDQLRRGIAKRLFRGHARLWTLFGR